LRVTRPRSAFDRYDDAAPTEAPTESAVLHVIVPPRGTATLTPRGRALDLALAELDPDAPPMTVPALAADAPPPVTRRLGETEWGGFVPRRPTNAAAFGAEGQRTLRIARRLAPAASSEPGATIAHVPAAKGAQAKIVDGRTFERAEGPLAVSVGEGAVLPLRLLADEPMEVVARVDDGAPMRQASGTAERVTVTRRFAIGAGESRAAVVLGDDLRPGAHTLTLSAPHGKALWVHAPWVHARVAPPRPRAVPTPRWVAGDFEE
jgi:hypothetical protein